MQSAISWRSFETVGAGTHVTLIYRSKFDLLADDLCYQT